MVGLQHARIGKELSDLIRKIKAQALLDGRKPPSTSQITDVIAKKIKEKEILLNEFIRFK